MIVGLKILDDFTVEDVEELVKGLTERKLIDYSFAKVKKLVEKEFSSDFDDVSMNDDAIDFVLSDLAIGNFYWEFRDGADNFTIFVCDPNSPYTKDGKIPNSKQKVEFT